MLSLLDAKTHKILEIMQKKHIYLSPPDIGKDERKLPLDAFDSNWIAPLGPCVDSFEQQLATHCQREACAALASGTAAIPIALKMLGCQTESTVLTQSFKYKSTIEEV